jgi:tetratricopeptide (TPR) repeat protein
MAKRTGKPRTQTIKPIPPARPWLSEVTALESVSPDLVGLVLWFSLRNVRTLAETLPDRDPRTMFSEYTQERRERYAYAQVLAPELTMPLGVFALLRQSPQLVDREQVALACHRVAGWAEKHGMLEMASHFAEAAAAVNPESAELAVAAGRACRRAAALFNASVWFERGFGLAVRAKSRKHGIAALLGYGAVVKAEGRREEAQEWFRKAARGASRTGRARQSAEARHDLMTIAAEIGTFEEIDEHVTAALALYPDKHPYLPALAHDLGYGFVRLHNYAAAVALVEMARDRMRSPSIRALFWSTLAWAQAGAGRTEIARTAEQKALELVAVHDEYAPAVLLHLAEAGRVLRDWPRALRYADEARRAAEKLQDAALAREAAELIAVIDARVPAPAQDDGPDPERAAWLVRRMRDKLQKWRAPGERGRPPGAGPNG